MRSMNNRALALGFACLGFFTGLAPLAAQAQQLRLQGGGAKGLSSQNGPAGVRPSPPLSRAATQAAEAAAAVPTIRQADYIVAIVNSEPLTNNEVKARVARVEQSFASQRMPLPAPDLLAREVLERLILEKALLQRAKETGVRVDDYAVTQAEQNVARQNDVTVPELHRRLRADGLDPVRFREELRNQLLLQRLRERDLESQVRVSEPEIDQYLREQQSSSQAAPAAINLGHILVSVPEGASAAVVDAAQARAQEAAEKARRPGADFAALAREFSDAPEGKTGGELGLRSTDRYPELFVEALRQVPVGGVAGPVRSGAGFHVLKVLERSEGVLPATVLKNHVRHILLRTNPQQNEAAAAQRLADYRRRIERGEATFEALAREFSQDGSAKQGGDLGWAAPGRYVPEFEQVVESLQPGQISEPLVSRFGVHLVQLLDRREVPLTPREQRELARNALQEKKLEDAYVTWAQEQRARAYVELRDPPQ